MRRGVLGSTTKADAPGEVPGVFGNFAPMTYQTLRNIATVLIVLTIPLSIIDGCVGEMIWHSVAAAFAIAYRKA